MSFLKEKNPEMSMRFATANQHILKEVDEIISRFEEADSPKKKENIIRYELNMLLARIYWLYEATGAEEEKNI